MTLNPVQATVDDYGSFFTLLPEEKIPRSYYCAFCGKASCTISKWGVTQEEVYKGGKVPSRPPLVWRCSSCAQAGVVNTLDGRLLLHASRPEITRENLQDLIMREKVTRMILSVKSKLRR